MRPRIIVVAHNLRSCHNVGSLLRTCDGIGVEKVILSGYTPYPAGKDDMRLPHLSQKIDKQINKTALGAQNTQAWEYIQDIKEPLKRLSSDGYLICALEQSEKSIPIHKFKTTSKIVLIIGNEKDGLDEWLLNETEKILEIPMYGKKESYNVIQATAMALYSFRFSGK